MDTGYFEGSRETGSVLSRIALWDCFRGRILTQFPTQLHNSLKR